MPFGRQHRNYYQRVFLIHTYISQFNKEQEVKKMSGNNKEPMDVVNQFIDKNKDALSEISFGGGTELIVVVMVGMRCNAVQCFSNEKPSLCLWSCPVVYVCSRHTENSSNLSLLLF